jgi:hypothetical protein
VRRVQTVGVKMPKACPPFASALNDQLGHMRLQTVCQDATMEPFWLHS